MLVFPCRLLLCFFALQKDLRSLIMTLPLPALLILQRGFVGLDLTTVKKSAQVKILDICMSIKFNTLAFYMSLFYYMSLYYYMSLFYYIIYNVKLTGSQRIRHNWAHTHTHTLPGTSRVPFIRAEMLFASLFSLSESRANHDWVRWMDECVVE